MLTHAISDIFFVYAQVGAFTRKTN